MACDRKKPFVPVDCSGLVPTLIESELFRLRKRCVSRGAQHFLASGCWKGAEGGTVFLDEIGDLPIDLQAKFTAGLAGARKSGLSEPRIALRIKLAHYRRD